MSRPLKGFITYSHEDIKAKKELRKRLAVMEQQNELVTWDDGQLTPGDKALQEDILKEVANSDLLLYLVSAASLASKNCNRELAEASKGDKRVIPIILEHCDWQRHQLSGFEVLPYKGKPINEWKPTTKGWQKVVDGIWEAIDGMQAQPDSSSGTSEEELRAELAFQNGNVLMMFGQPNMAIETYSQAIDFNPRNTDAYYNRGLAYNEKGEFENAINDYSRAIELDPRDAKAYNNRGNAHQEKGEVEKAIKDYDMAIELDPCHAKAYYNRGAAYNEKGEFERAIEDCTRAIELDPCDANAYNNRGNAHRKKGEVEKAIKDYDMAIELDPCHAKAYCNRGFAYNEKGEFENAINDYKTAIQLQPDFVEAYDNRGLAYVSKGEFENAINDYTKAIQLNPNYISVYVKRLVVQLFIKEWEEARAGLNLARDRGLDISPEFRRTWGSVEDFKRKTDIQLPEDIAAMLTQQED